MSWVNLLKCRNKKKNNEINKDKRKKNNLYRRIIRLDNCSKKSKS